MTNGVPPDDDNVRAAFARLRRHDRANAPGFGPLWARAQARRGPSRAVPLSWALGLGAAAALGALLLWIVLAPPSLAHDAPPSPARLQWTFPVDAPEPLAFLLELPSSNGTLEASR